VGYDGAKADYWSAAFVLLDMLTNIAHYTKDPKFVNTFQVKF
jgi:hypothetical protein